MFLDDEVEGDTILKLETEGIGTNGRQLLRHRNICVVICNSFLTFLILPVVLFFFKFKYLLLRNIIEINRQLSKASTFIKHDFFFYFVN